MNRFVFRTACDKACDNIDIKILQDFLQHRRDRVTGGVQPSIQRPATETITTLRAQSAMKREVDYRCFFSLFHFMVQYSRK